MYQVCLVLSVPIGRDMSPVVLIPTRCCPQSCPAPVYEELGNFLPNVPVKCKPKRVVICPPNPFAPTKPGRRNIPLLSADASTVGPVGRVDEWWCGLACR